MDKKRKRRKKIFNRRIILEKLLNIGETSSSVLLGLILEFFDIAKAMSLPLPAAQREMRKQKPPRHIKIDLKSKVAFWTLISRLKKEGLIKNNNGKITLTKNGKKYLREASKKLPTNKEYPAEKIKTQEIILVIFDIPEKEKYKREWLRFQLKQLDFRVLQKSVWWGMAGLPKEFLKDLKKYKILPYVHIFSVKKRGTISAALSEQFTIASDRSK